MTEHYDFLGSDRGRCFLCGEDARHRLGDSIAGWYGGGMTPAELAAEFRLTEEAIIAFLETYVPEGVAKEGRDGQT